MLVKINKRIWIRLIHSMWFSPCVFLWKNKDQCIYKWLLTFQKLIDAVTCFSRLPCLRSCADPVVGFEDRSSNGTSSPADTQGSIPNGKHMVKKNWNLQASVHMTWLLKKLTQNQGGYGLKTIEIPVWKGFPRGYLYGVIIMCKEDRLFIWFSILIRK